MANFFLVHRRLNPTRRSALSDSDRQILTQPQFEYDGTLWHSRSRPERFKPSTSTRAEARVVICAARLRRIRRDLESRGVASQEIGLRIDELTRQVELLGSLEDDRTHLSSTGVGQDVVARISGLIDEARDLILKPDFAAADEALKKIGEELDKAVLDLRTQGLQVGRHAASAISAISETLRASRVEIYRAITAQRIARPPLFAKTMAFLAGTAPLSVRDQYRYLAPLYSLVLLVALAVWGATIFYSGSEHQTFGANRVSDYFPLFLWGFGADVLNKRLQGIHLGES